MRNAAEGFRRGSSVPSHGGGGSAKNNNSSRFNCVDRDDTKNRAFTPRRLHLLSRIEA